MLDIEFKLCQTSSLSPWHLDIADKYNYPLMITSDIGYFVKIGNDIYRMYGYEYYELYQYVIKLEEKNTNGELSDEETLKELEDIMKGDKYRLEKCIPLEKFERIIKEKAN